MFVLGFAVACLVCTIWMTQSAMPSAGKPSKFEVLTFDQIDPANGRYRWNSPEFLAGLRGQDAWELLVVGQTGILFRHSVVNHRVEYQTIKFEQSPFNSTQQPDVAAFMVLLERMSAEGYVPCAVNEGEQTTLFRRMSEGHSQIVAFQLVRWCEILEANEGLEPWNSEVFQTTFNRHGGNGWRACVCTERAVLFCKTESRWEYQTIRISNNPLRNKIEASRDDEAAAFNFILEGHAAKGWIACGLDRSSQQFLLMRELPQTT